MKLKNKDVETVEFLHDRLVRVYEENYNNDYLINARKTIDVIRQKVNDDSTNHETAFHKHNVSVSLLRECAVRTHLIFPTNDKEMDWHNEGITHEGNFMKELFRFMVKTQ